MDDPASEGATRTMRQFECCKCPSARLIHRIAAPRTGSGYSVIYGSRLLFLVAWRPRISITFRPQVGTPAGGGAPTKAHPGSARAPMPPPAVPSRAVAAAHDEPADVATGAKAEDPEVSLFCHTD